MEQSFTNTVSKAVTQNLAFHSHVPNFIFLMQNIQRHCF